MKIKKSYSSKQSAKNAMWSYVKSLQIAGIHTGALRGDDGLTAQWTTNASRTQWATVVHDNNYYVAARKWFVRLSTDED